MATRLLNLISGLIILATGLYVELGFAARIPDTLRWALAGAALLYFMVQLVRFVIAECAAEVNHASVPLSREFRA